MTHIIFWRPLRGHFLPVHLLYYPPAVLLLAPRFNHSSSCLSATVSGTYTSLPADCGNRSSGGPATKGDLGIYPNPTSGKLALTLPLKEGERARLTVLDMAGRQLLQSTLREAQGSLDVSRLPDGVYLLHAQLPSGKVLTQKVVVRHEGTLLETSQP